MKIHRRVGLALIVLLLLSLACKTLSYKGGLPADREAPQVRASLLLVRLEQVSVLWGAKPPLPEGCVQKSGVLRVEPGKEPALLQGCIVQAGAADASHPRLAVRNPQNFYVAVRPAQNTWTYPPAGILAPGEKQEFTANTADPSPLVVLGERTSLANLHSLVDLALVLLPGKHQLGANPRVVTCLAGSDTAQAEMAEMVIAAQSLANQDAPNAAKFFTQALRDKNSANRLIRAAQTCGYDPAQRWELTTLRQTGQFLFNQQDRLEFALSALTGAHEGQVVFGWKK